MNRRIQVMPAATPKKNIQWLMPLIYLVAFSLIWYSLQHASTTPQPKQIPYSEFLSEIRGGHVSDVTIDEQHFIAKLKTEPGKTEAAKEISTQRLPGMDETSLLKDLEAQGVTFSGHTLGSSWWSFVLPWVIPILLVVLITGYGSRKLAQGPGPLTFGKSRAKI